MSRKLVSEMWEHIGHMEPVTIEAGVTIYKACLLLDTANVGALIVIGENGEVTGVISERDVVRKVNVRNLNQFTTHVSDIMTSEVISVTPGTTHDECMNLMDQKGIRHLPVIDHGKAVGMVSMKDIIRSDEYDSRILHENLEHYLKRVG